MTLHTILQRQTVEGMVSRMELSLPEPCSVGDLLSLLEIELHPEDLILAVNGRMADTTLVLKQGDRVDLIPAISGG